jgi:hypothetical protein
LRYDGGETYKAILRGNRLESSDERPEGLSPERELPVIVTILDEPDSPSQGARMADALQRLAEAGGVHGIEDPLQWERQLRRDSFLRELA